MTSRASGRGQAAHSADRKMTGQTHPRARFVPAWNTTKPIGPHHGDGTGGESVRAGGCDCRTHVQHAIADYELTGHPAIILPNASMATMRPKAHVRENGEVEGGGPGTPLSLTFLDSFR